MGTRPVIFGSSGISGNRLLPLSLEGRGWPEGPGEGDARSGRRDFEYASPFVTLTAPR
jgi:hypothetical protein